MSLAQLRTARLAGKRPGGPVVVAFGCADRDASPSVVGVLDPAADLRPLMGLQAHVFDMQSDSARFVRLLDALKALDVKTVGICGPAGTCGCSEEHERAMERYRECL